MKNYKIDYTTNTITLTKKFMQEAGIINSEAFKTMQVLRSMGMTMMVKEAAHRKNTSITYAQMVQYIHLVENSAFYMAQFEAMRAEVKSKRDSYVRMRAWFRQTFPNFYEMPEFNADNKIIVTPDDYPADAA